MCVYVRAHGYRKRAWDPVEMHLWVLMGSSVLRVLESELQS